MTRTSVTLIGLAVTTTAWAQSPVQPAIFVPESARTPVIRPELPGLPQSAKPGPLPQAVVEQRQRFDPQSVNVKLDGRRWQLWADQTMLRDFGEQRERAFEARRIIADLGLNERGAIGTPEPVMEFWLCNGAAPHPPAFGRDVIPFDPNTVRTEKVRGVNYVRDDRQLLFNFGPYEADAKLAVNVLQRYGFNEVGLIGLPTPSMTYLIKNPNPRQFMPSGDASGRLRQLPQVATRHALTLPKLGTVGESTPFDPMRAEIRKAGDGWHLVIGPHDLGTVGRSDYAARQSLLAVQQYPLNEYVRIGESGYGFFLSRTQAPRGVPIGIRRTAFDPKALTVKQVDDKWVLGDGKQVVATFRADQGSDAKLTLQVLQHYGFDSQCDVSGGLKFLAKER